MKGSALACLIALLAISACSTPENQSLDLHVGGRVQTTPGQIGYRYQWPAIYFEGAFTGTEFFIETDDTGNRYRLLIDGKPHIQLADEGHATLHVTGLTNATHSIRLEKLNESQSYRGAFNQILVPEGMALPAPAPRARQIEFIGDSAMVGMGILSNKRDCTPDETFETTDSSQSYTTVVAKQYNADYQLNAYSGIGMVRNYDGAQPDRTMPLLYPRVLFDDPTPYADPDWNPQIIVIAFGGSDFATPLKPGEKWADTAALRADWEATFIKFIADLRARNPKAFILMTASETFNNDYLTSSRAVLAAVQNQGDTRIALITYPSLENTGCLWHPNLNDHKTMAGIVARFIDATPDIWQGK